MTRLTLHRNQGQLDRICSTPYNYSLMATATAASSARLKSAKLRRTPMRIAILNLLAGESAPQTVPDILQNLPDHSDSVTVYRTLNTFTKQKLVHRVRGDDRVWRYALSEASQPARHSHAHFVCDQCGKVECLKESPIPRSLKHPAGMSTDYAVSYSEVVVHGTCPKCNA